LYTLTDGDRQNTWDSQNRLASLIKTGKICDVEWRCENPIRRL